MNETPLQLLSVSFFTEVYTPIINGVVASIDGLRAGLRDAGVNVTVVAPHFPHARTDDRSVIRLPSLPLPTQTGYRLCVPYLSHAARERIARTNIVHVHSPFVSGRLGSNIARRSGVPLVFTYHTRIDEYAHYVPFESRLTRSALIALTRAFANRADTVIAPSAAMRERLREIGVRVPIAIVPSSIDVAAYVRGERTTAARALLGARNDSRIALTVARIAKEKQLELAIDALARTRDLHLAIVGDGPHRNALVELARARGVSERVTFTGMLDPRVLPDLYASSDAFVFPSASETQGLVLAEALAARLPVVAVDTAVNREMLGGFGRLVAAEPQALAEALTLAVAAPRDPAAAQDASDRFGRARQTAAVLNVYRAISVCRTFGTPVRDHAPG